MARFDGSTGMGTAPDAEDLDATSSYSTDPDVVPNLRVTKFASVGRDGSLIVPRGPENFGTCRFDLYPQLLK